MLLQQKRPLWARRSQCLLLLFILKRPLRARRSQCLLLCFRTMKPKQNAASSAPPMRWAARCVVYVYSADSPVALSRSDGIHMIMVLFEVGFFNFTFFGKSNNIKLAQGQSFPLFQLCV